MKKRLVILMRAVSRLFGTVLVAIWFEKNQ